MQMTSTIIDVTGTQVHTVVTIPRVSRRTRAAVTGPLSDMLISTQKSNAQGCTYMGIQALHPGAETAPPIVCLALIYIRAVETIPAKPRWAGAAVKAARCINTAYHRIPKTHRIKYKQEEYYQHYFEHGGLGRAHSLIS